MGMEDFSTRKLENFRRLTLIKLSRSFFFITCSSFEKLSLMRVKSFSRKISVSHKKRETLKTFKADVSELLTSFQPSPCEQCCSLNICFPLHTFLAAKWEMLLSLFSVISWIRSTMRCRGEDSVEAIRRSAEWRTSVMCERLQRERRRE